VRPVHCVLCDVRSVLAEFLRIGPKLGPRTVGSHLVVAASLRARSAESSGMSRPQKITFGEMRSSGVRGLLIYCSDYNCSHSINADSR
jgi:hypothetical protein